MLRNQRIKERLELQEVEVRGELRKTRVLLDGRSFSPPVEGLDVVDAFELGHGYLLLMTEDCPFEEALHIYFFGEDGRLKDHLELAAPYTSGLVRGVEWAGANKLNFRFPAESSWQVEIRERPLSPWQPPLRQRFRPWSSFFHPRYLTIESRS